MSKKIAVAMSGGVDSSVVAKILKNEGHHLVGLFLKLWSDPTSSVSGGLRGAGPTCRKENRCCDYEALEDARMVAAKLGIPFYVIDAKVEFKKEVVDYFLREYQNLRTPNPCIVCNETIKFDLLLKKALSIGCDYLATGHYARISCHPHAGGDPPARRSFSSSDAGGLIVDSRLHGNDKLYHLFKGVDETKDQSYMLYRLNQQQLSHVLFPIGEMTKKDVRNLAIKWDLPVKEKPESQEICFFADKDFRTFLRRYLDEKYFAPGNIVDSKGNIIGNHDGLLNYTIGQRKLIDQQVIPDLVGDPPARRSFASSDAGGLLVDSRLRGNDKQPLYVIGFDAQKNQLIVGGDKDVYKKEMIVSDFYWIDNNKKSDLKSKKLKVRIRYHHPEVRCVIARSKATRRSQIKVLFDKPQRAVTPGQSAVFYIGDEVIGGGIIES